MTNAVRARLAAALSDRYRVERELGAGGMATVYLAEDVRHRRKVAVKVLHPELSAVLGGERFLKEIELTANLQHPHILPLFDSGEAGGQLFYVMPFVEGETLRARLEREQQLPVDESLRLIREVADALQYAHDRGVVHRDIKPENILLQGGHALVADFGIALAVQQAGGQRMTQTGLSLGTPQYMAPEQAMGERTVGPRADIYAMSTVLYEMLTGAPPFTGGTLQAIVARVLTEKPGAPSAVRDTIPPAVERAILTALAKIPADRFATAADFAAALERTSIPAASMERLAPIARAPRATYLVIAALALAGSTLWALNRPRGSSGSATASSAPMIEATILLPDSAPLAYLGSVKLGVGLPALAITPDGATLVYAAQSGATTRLYKRSLSGGTVEPIAGTEGAYAPFTSPDGRSIGYFVGGSVRRTTMDGKTTTTVADVVLPYGATWLSDGRIIVADQEGHQLVSLPENGGPPTNVGPAAGSISSDNPSHVFPEPLPGERELLMTTGGHRLAIVAIASGEVWYLGPDGAVRSDSVTAETPLFSGSHPRYVAAAGGHVVFQSLDGNTHAFPFDVDGHRVLGAPVPVLSGVRTESIWGAGQLVVSRDGVLVYARGANGRRTWLVWRDGRGKIDTLSAFGQEDYGMLDLSTDGARLLIRRCVNSGACDLEVLNLREGVRIPFAASRTTSGGAVWRGIGWMDARRLYSTGVRPRPGGQGTEPFSLASSPDLQGAVDTLPGVTVLDMAADGAVLFDTGDTLRVAPSWRSVLARRSAPGFTLDAPDAWGHNLRRGGDWLAYTARSEQAGDYVVYIARTTPPYDRYRVSPRGGEEPVWYPSGDLSYREGSHWMRVTPPSAPGTPPAAAREEFAGPFLNVLGRSHDIAPDGRHLLIEGPANATTTRLTIVTQWTTTLPARGWK